MNALAGFYQGHWILTALVALPLAGAAACLLVREFQAKHVALAVSTAALLLSLPLFWTFDVAEAGFQNAVSMEWIPGWGVSYAVGIDGISILMVLLTTFIMPLAVAGSFSYIQKRQRAFYAMLLLLETGMVGVFVALDLFLFFVFWEIMLVPMYFLIGIWGGGRRVYSAVKFFLYTSAGSLLMLVAILALAGVNQGQTGEWSFAYADLLQTELGRTAQMWLFAGFAVAFLVKVPVFPFHTWLPDAHVDAPTAGSVVLAGVLLKMGVYGLLRYGMPLFPEAATDPTVLTVLLVLGLVGVIYAAWVAAVQPDAKKLIAYTSVAHLGFVMIGVFGLTRQGIEGGILQMVNHGVSTGALFLLVGMLYERRHTREIADFGGLAKVMPLFATALVVVALSSIGLPGTNGFVGEFLILLGTFQTRPWIAAIATTGVIFAACYMLPMVQRILFNRLDRDENRVLPDMNLREKLVMAPLLVMIVLVGVLPGPFLVRTQASTEALLVRISRDAPASVDSQAEPGGELPPPAGEPGGSRP